MPSLDHSIANIVRWALIDKGRGTDPSLNQPWPIYAGAEPDYPDNVLTVYRTTGRANGWYQVTGEMVLRYGFQVRIRGITDEVAEIKANNLLAGLNEDLTTTTVVLDSSTYCCTPATVTSDIGRLGSEQSSARSVYTINAVIDVKQVS